MEIVQKAENGTVCLTIKGRIDAGSSSKLEKAVEKIRNENNSRLLFDLGNLEYLKSQELRVILNAVKKIKQNGTKIVFCALNDNVKEIFDVCGIGANIHIANSVESGLKFEN